MVERLFGWLNREWGSLHQAAFLLGISALASQILALVRDRLLAARFGAGQELDIYYAAFRVPDLLYVSLASFVSVTILIPFIVNNLKENDGRAAREFLNSVFTAFFLFMIPLLLIVWFLAPALAPRVAPGFTPAALAELTTLMRILLLSPLLLGLSNLFGAITQSVNKFLIYALSPVLYNLGIILGILFFYPQFGLSGLAYGVVLGALLHAAIQLPGVIHSRLLPRATTRIDWPALGRVLAISLPRTLTLGAHQIALSVLVALGSLLGVGAVAVFNFAFNLQSVPLSIIGVSYSVAAFPLLVKLFSNGQKKEFTEHLSSAMRHIIFWSIPAIAMFVILRAQIVRVILGAGEFDWRDTRLTAAALALFALSLVGQSLVLLFVRAYYASGLTKRPFVLHLISSLSMIVLAWILLRADLSRTLWWDLFERALRVEGVANTGMLILPLSYTLGVFVNLVLFWHFFQKDFGHFPRVVDRAIAQSAIASLLAGLVAYQTLNWLAPLLNQDTFVGILAQGAVAGFLGMAIFVIALRYFKNKEIGEIEKALREKLWQTKPIAPEPEGL
jgi:putative peptidoglycan lipid II flippase